MRFAIIIITAFLLFISCGSNEGYKKEVINGVEVFYNKNRPNNPDFNVNVTKLFSIDNEDSDNPADTIKYIRRIGSVEVDNAGNLYVLERRRRVILKFDDKGEFITHFGNKGKGPGELLWTRNMIILGDTIYVPDHNGLKIVKYDLDGNFTNEKKFNSSLDFPGSIVKFGNKYANILVDFERLSGGKRKRTNKTVISNTDFEFENTVYEKTIEFDINKGFDPDLLDFYIAADNSMLYVSEASYDNYVVNGFDKNGKKVITIKKSYIRVPKTKEELAHMKRRSERRGVNLTGKYRKSIQSLMVDSKGRLWVESPTKNPEERGFDIFKDGIFLKRINIDGIEPDMEFYMKSDRLISLNYRSGKIDVYKID